MNLDAYLAIVKQSIEKLGKEDGAVLGLSAPSSSIATHSSDRNSPRTGKPDQHSRVMLQDWELGLAVNHALRVHQAGR